MTEEDLPHLVLTSADQYAMQESALKVAEQISNWKSLADVVGYTGTVMTDQGNVAIEVHEYGDKLHEFSSQWRFPWRRGRYMAVRTADNDGRSGVFLATFFDDRVQALYRKAEAQAKERLRI